MIPLVAFALVATLAAAIAQEPGPVILELKRVMGERLAVMHDVARYKWTHGVAIEDVERERVVLARTAERAVAAGVEPELAERMVRAQIEAAKQVQRSDFVAWEAAGAGPFDPAPDLTADLRPRITQLTDELIAALRVAAPLLDECAAHAALEAPPAVVADDPEAWAIAVDGLWAQPPSCSPAHRGSQGQPPCPERVGEKLHNSVDQKWITR